MAKILVEKLGRVGCKAALRLVELAQASVAMDSSGGDDDDVVGSDYSGRLLSALSVILDDLAGDDVAAGALCEVL